MIDFVLFRALNNLAGESAILDIFGVFLAIYLINLILLLIVVISAIRRKISIFLFAVLSGLLGFLISQAIAAVNFRPRPFVFLEGVNLLISKSSLSKSFPSDHATLSFAFAASLFFFGEKKWGVVALVMAFFVSLGRVYVGVHFPFDVLGGAALGVCSALIVDKIWQKIKLKIPKLKKVL